MKKLTEQELMCIREQFTFYDFEDFSGINKNDIKIMFSRYIPETTYSDVTCDEERELYINKQTKLGIVINSILHQVRDEYCIITKYNDRWIVNKKKSKKLFRILRQSNVKIKATAALYVNKSSSDIELFIKSTLKYNSFVQLLFISEKMIMTITDHMDVFISVDNKDFIQVVENSVIDFNTKYCTNENSYSVFDIIKISKD